MITRLVIFGLLSLALALPGKHALAQSSSPARVALIIGNAKYPDAEAPLKDPIADARALAETLKSSELGFDVELAENLTKDGMLRAFGRFYGKIKSGSVAMVFFSGYAIQSARQSYLLPVDGQIWVEGDVRRDGISLETILKEMNSRGASVQIAVLDASRRSALERRVRPVAAGLAPVVPPNGSLVMYSAAPGTAISDTNTDQRLFVRELIKEMRTPGLIADAAFKRTQVAVNRASDGKQVPWFSSLLTSDFSFLLRSQPSSSRPPAVASAPPVSPPTAPENKPIVIPKLDPVIPEAAPSQSTAVSPPPASSPPPTSSLPPATRPPPPPSPPETAAIRELNRKLEDNPNDTAARYRRGQLYASNNDFPRAEKDFDEIIRVNPRDAEAFNNRCWVRAMLGDLTAALNDCDEALRLKPNYADGLDSRGFVKLKIGTPRNAIPDYDEALRLQARKASSLYGRGIAKLRTGNTSGGNADIAAAKAIDARIGEEFAGYGINP
jgi:tetratricopeptide (TPR) repeat protein